MQVDIDLEKCAGHARCFAVDPELFELDDSGYALNAVVDVPQGAEKTARLAVGQCPERAMRER